VSAREAVLEELDAAVSAPSGAAVVSGAPTCSVALLGQPNSGKSTLFNALTGSRQRVGNWPGKTVEKKEGGFSRGGVDYAVCDLPGTYSLSANSEEEVVTRDYIASGRADVVCVLADASQLERSLYMLADFAGVDCACMLVLNLMDVAEAQGKRIDAKVLERRLGIPVVPFVAADRAHCDLFYQALDRAIADPHALDATALAEACRVEFGAVYDDVRALVPERSVGALTPAWLTGKLLEGDVPVRALVDEALDERDRARLAAGAEPIEHGVQRGGTCKFSWIDGVLDGAVRGSRTRSTLSRFDRIATGSRWGKPLAIGIILVGLLATFVPAMPIMAGGGPFPLHGRARCRPGSARCAGQLRERRPVRQPAIRHDDGGLRVRHQPRVRRARGSGLHGPYLVRVRLHDGALRPARQVHHAVRRVPGVHHRRRVRHPRAPLSSTHGVSAC